MKGPPLRITVCGDWTVFETFKDAINRTHMQEVLPWKKPNATFPCHIVLPIEFSPFDETRIDGSNAGFDYLRHGSFHIYWIACKDGEEYRIKIRESLVHWFALLRDANVSEWLIVMDCSAMQKSTMQRSKSSVLERLRADFSKHTDRILELDSSLKHWAELIRILRRSLLTTLTNIIVQYLADLQALRDQYKLESWHFCDVANLQITLAGLYASLDLYDDSIVQYDALEALLSQHVWNAVTSETGKPAWLNSLIESSRTLQLVPSIADFFAREPEFHDRIKTRKISLIELKHALFCEQIWCLINQTQQIRAPKETLQKDAAAALILQYTDRYLTSIKENYRLLKIDFEFSEDFLRIFSIVIAMESFDLCEFLCEVNSLERASGYVCRLWWSTCVELFELYKKMKNCPAPEEFLSRLLQFIPENRAHLFPEKILEAGSNLRRIFSAKNIFVAELIKIFEQAIAVLKHFFWKRHSRILGGILAEIYVETGEISMGASNYSKFLAALERSGWDLIFFASLKKFLPILAQDEKFGIAHVRYSLLLAACPFKDFRSFISDEERLEYWKNFKSALNSFGNSFEIRDSEIFSLKKIQISHQPVLVSGGKLEFDLELESSLVVPVGVEIRFCFMEASKALQIRQRFSVECSEDGIAAKFTHPRLMSVGSGEMLGDCTNSISIFEPKLELNPGLNRKILDGKPEQCGRFALDHVHFRLLEAPLTLVEKVNLEQCVQIFVEQRSPNVRLESEGSFLLMGLRAELQFEIQAGSQKIPADTELEFLTENGANFENSSIRLQENIEPIQQTLISNRFRVPFCDVFDASVACHKITCVMLDKKYEFELTFTAPFFTSHDLLTASQRKFLRIILNTGVHEISIGSVALKTEPAIDQIVLLNGDLGADLIGANETYTLVWSFGETTFDDLKCFLSINFRLPGITGNDELHEYAAKFSIQNVQTRYELAMNIEAPSGVCRVDLGCDLHMPIKAVHLGEENAHLMVEFSSPAGGQFWEFSERRIYVTLDHQGYADVMLNLVPKAVGYLPMPEVKFWKCLPESPHLTADIGMCIPIPSNQLYLRTAGKQVHVLQPVKKTFSIGSPVIKEKTIPKQSIEIDL